MREEFELCVEARVKPLPISATGFMAERLWKEVAAEFEKHFPGASADFKRQFKKLCDASKRPAESPRDSPDTNRISTERLIMAKRVYLAFDYEDVSDFRANVVRKHNFTGGVEKPGYFDASPWEEAKKKDPTTLYLGLFISTDGRKGTPTVWDGSRWVSYSDLAALGIKEQPGKATAIIILAARLRLDAA